MSASRKIVDPSAVDYAARALRRAERDEHAAHGQEETPPLLQQVGVVADGDQYADSTALMLDVDSVLVVDRYRKALGDVSDLARSIAEVGLLNPITVREWRGGYRLVAGARRLSAFKSLGLAEIPARVARDIADARDALVAERDENTARKPMLPSEATALGIAIQKMEAPAASERQAATRFGGVPGNTTAEPDKWGHKTRDIAAEAVGMSSATFTRMKTLVTVAADENEPEEVREAARAAVEDIDNGASIRSGYDRVKALREPSDVPAEPKPLRGTRQQRAQKWEQIAEYAERRFTVAQIAKTFGMSEGGLRAGAKREGIRFPADEVIGKRKRINGIEVMERIVASLEGDESAVTLVDFQDITPQQAAEWLQRLSRPLRAMNQMKNRLKEISGE